MSQSVDALIHLLIRLQLTAQQQHVKIWDVCTLLMIISHRQIRESRYYTIQMKPCRTAR